MALSPEDARRALIALTRFGLGPKPGTITAEFAKDPKAALRRETWDPTKLFIDDDALPSTQEALTKHFKEALAERAARESNRDDSREMRVAKARSLIEETAPSSMGMNATNMSAMNTQASPQRPAQPQQPPQIEQVIYRSEVVARLKKATEPAVGFGERLVLFWSNHFCISVGKGQVTRAVAGALEREAIRPNVFGKFSDMLLAVEKHPGMLYYLDNRQSVGPTSRAGKSRNVGLNENLAREILELHTLGVDGGYKQADVTSLAKVITGWTFVGANERLGPVGTFVFTANRHEPGVQTILGKSYPDTGVEQGEIALRDISRHPATAKHIARKLVRHFVSDTEPSQALVDRLTKVFTDTDGDLGEVSRALINHEDAWKGETAKMRTPYEWLAAIARFAGAPTEPGQILQPLNLMGMPIWAVPGPNGYPDVAAYWASPEGMRTRLDLSSQIARRLGDRFNPSELATELFDAALSPETAQAIRRAESKHQGLAILMMSPEFLRR